MTIEVDFKQNMRAVVSLMLSIFVANSNLSPTNQPHPQHPANQPYPTNPTPGHQPHATNPTNSSTPPIFMKTCRPRPENANRI